MTEKTSQLSLAEQRSAPLEVVEGEIMSGRNLYNDIPALLNAFERLKSKYLVVMPVKMIEVIPEMHSVALRPLNISTDPNDPNDWYKERRTGLYGMKRPALVRFATSGGVDWDPKWHLRVDNQTNPYYAAFRAHGELVGLDGLRHTLDATAVEDWREGAPQWLELQDLCASKKKEFRTELIREAMFCPEQAETRAILRALRNYYSLPHGFSEDEVRKPIIVPGLAMFTRAHSDPEVNKEVQVMLAREQMRASRMIYGPEPAEHGHAAIEHHPSAPPPIEHQPPPAQDAKPQEPTKEAQEKDKDIPF